MRQVVDLGTQRQGQWHRGLGVAPQDTGQPGRKAYSTQLRPLVLWCSRLSFQHRTRRDRVEPLRSFGRFGTSVHLWWTDNIGEPHHSSTSQEESAERGPGHSPSQEGLRRVSSHLQPTSSPTCVEPSRWIKIDVSRQTSPSPMPREGPLSTWAASAVSPAAHACTVNAGGQPDNAWSHVAFTTTRAPSYRTMLAMALAARSTLGKMGTPACLNASSISRRRHSAGPGGRTSTRGFVPLRR